jgi:preprotein translocase subunit SecA
MEILERIWEVLGAIVNAILRRFERTVTGLFGSANARSLRRMQPKVAAISALAPKYAAMSDDELRQQTVEFRKRLEQGETLDDLLVEAFAVCREAGQRFLGLRHYDVQMLGGMILHGGNIAEMVTGEGKTLTATLPAYLNALGGSVHVVTVNDYLARRDMEWMGPLFTNLGLTVGAIYSGMETEERQAAYACDITYGTNNEFGFDYLRDNMRLAARGDDAFPKHMQQSQGRLVYAIIDEVDNILIDEARTPLIISGPAEDDITKYVRADKVARQLQRDTHFEVKEKEHSANLTDAGVRAAEQLAGVESFYTAGNMQWPHLIDNALKAHHLYKRDVNYVVQEGRVVIVDDHTGRLMEGRQWSDGLHQAVEAKEGVQIKQENQTLATITLQNFFKLYKKLSGMTGTALTEAPEFWSIYKLDVIGVPTNRPMQRTEYPDVIFRTEREKFQSIADDIERLHKHTSVELAGGEWLVGKLISQDEQNVELELLEGKERRRIPRAKVRSIQLPGRPILVGTVSIEKSERLSKLLDGRGIKHELLNAKQHKREAEIVAQAGRKGAVTIATNMAGRGTDIILGGNPETAAWAQLQSKYASRLDVPNEEWDELVDQISRGFQMKEQGQEVKALGGLCIIGTERHEARRIDLQLRGRSGRQGDPGSSRFYLSLEDDLMRIFAGEWVKTMLTRLGMQEGEAIESKMVSRRIEGAQKKVEERNFEVRKNLLEYDEVMDEQRKRVYGYRQRVLDGVNCRDLLLEMIRKQIDARLDVLLEPKYGVEAFAAAAGAALGTALDPRDFRNCTFEEADRIAHDEAERMAESQVVDAIEENLPSDDEESEWNWAAMAKWANTRFGLNYRDRDLKKIGRDELAEAILRDAREALAKVDLTPGERYLEPGFGARTACAWLREKFSIELNPDEAIKLEAKAFRDRAHQEATRAYENREAAYAALAGMYRYGAKTPNLDRDGLAEWAWRRFGLDASTEWLRSSSRDEVYRLLCEASAKANERASAVSAEAHERVQNLFAGDPSPGATLGSASGSNGKLGDFTAWLVEATGAKLTDVDLRKLGREEAHRRVSRCIEARFRPEMRRMERQVLLQVLDQAWKEHLLAMDHLRSSVGLRGYAQVDPKVEYKREGMRMFDTMWDNVGGYVTDLVFRMEQLDERFVGSTWVEAEARHDSPPPSVSAAAPSQQQQAIDASNQPTDHRPEPIRNLQDKIGRNDPCPCGSGKKYKQCCMRTS